MSEIQDFVGTKFRLLIGADHRGFEIKRQLIEALTAKGLDVGDVGPEQHDPADDYPDFAAKLGAAVSRGEADCGILICQTGIGMSIGANRFLNVRAALVDTPEKARASRDHNCSNVLVAGGNGELNGLLDIVNAWLETPYSGDPRHSRRLHKIERYGYDEIAAVRGVDPEIASWLDREAERQDEILELIASENIASAAVRAAQGSVLTNKYAEGYPGRRYYGGCEYVDEAERLALERVRDLFGAESANVQPHSGTSANMAMYMALLEPGDTVLAMDLAHGGHLSHGMKINFSGLFYNFIGYGVDAESEQIDYDVVDRLAQEHRPKMVLAGASAYPRILDFERFKAIADSVGAKLVVDMAHIAGLVAAGLHPNPIPYADVVTSTTHKTLRGPRGGLILCREEYIKKINSRIFPGTQGGPLMHVIAAKAVCFKEAAEPSFKIYQQQVLDNTRVLADELAAAGFRIVSGGTENHLTLVDLRPLNTTGKVAEEVLDPAGITVNKNLIPFDPEKPMVTSGLRLGTAAVTTRGLKEPEIKQVAAWIHRVISAVDDDTVGKAVREEVRQMTRMFPLPSI